MPGDVLASQAGGIETLVSAGDGGDTFKAVAWRWHGQQFPPWGTGHAWRSWRQLECDLFLRIGDRLLSELHSTELFSASQKVAQRDTVELLGHLLGNL